MKRLLLVLVIDTMQNVKGTTTWWQYAAGRIT
jgi:hypothetical protein